MTCPRCRTPLDLDRAIAGLVICQGCSVPLRALNGDFATGADVEDVSPEDVASLQRIKSVIRKALRQPKAPSA